VVVLALWSVGRDEAILTRRKSTKEILGIEHVDFSGSCTC
jgi:hypothetical protein